MKVFKNGNARTFNVFQYVIHKCRKTVTLEENKNNQEGQNISRSKKETTLMIASWKTQENFWRMNMNPREQRKVWPKKEQRRKGKDGGNQNKFTDPSITSVANVSQREYYCTKRRNWSAIAKCYRGNRKLGNEVLKKKCMVLMTNVKNVSKQEQKKGSPDIQRTNTCNFHF